MRGVFSFLFIKVKFVTKKVTQVANITMDKIELYLNNMDVSNIDFINETTSYFDVIGKHDYKNDVHVVSGKLGNFTITATDKRLTIGDGSLCKWYLGNNLDPMDRVKIQYAIEKLSDTLHLPINKATVKYFEFGHNFILDNPIQVYYNHLGELRYHKRQQVTDRNNKIEGLYYYGSTGMSVFYDKQKEQKQALQFIPEKFQNRNVLRYEQRYKRILPKTFNVDSVIAEMLYEERFFFMVVEKWGENYKIINKINDMQTNYEAIKGIKDLNNLGILKLVEEKGELEMIKLFDEMYSMGKINRKMKADMKTAIKKACSLESGQTIPSEVISELNKKVIEAVQYYKQTI